MQNFSDALKNRKQKPVPVDKSPNKRASIVKQFVVPLEASRATAGLKPLPVVVYAKRMSMMSEGELYLFLGRCKEAKNFSSFWWWNTDQKRLKETVEGLTK